jgi:argininosuccinate lyase
MASVVDGLELHPARFEEIARGSFVTAADVSDVLALHAGLDYRSAHTVVGRAVRDLVDAGEPPSALTAARLSAAAEETIGRPLEIDAEVLRDALDPAACAAARRQIGSSSPEAMQEMLEHLGATVARDAAWSEAAAARAGSTEAALLARARELSGA